MMRADPTNTEEDLTSWIQKNRMLFLFNPKFYTPDYVSWLARCNGFDPMMVYKRFSHFKHALALTSPEREQTRKTNWTIAEITSISQPVNLKESWEALAKQLIYGTDFEDAA